MKEECVHQVETLVHGLEALMKVKGELSILGQPALGRISGLLDTFRDHEAQEVGLFDRAHQVVTDVDLNDPPQLLRMVHDLHDEFLARALSALIACECGKT